MSFESTLPLGTPDLMRVSAFRRYLDELGRSVGGGDSGLMRLSGLGPSLLQDLMRFEESGHPAELLEVIAAGLRHARNLLIHLQAEERVLPLTIFPQERLAHCPLPLGELLQLRLAELQVLHVEPAVLRPPGSMERALVGELRLYHPLDTLSWELAMRGAREALLPEIAGSVAYRISPALALERLPLTGVLLAVVRRLQQRSTNLRELAASPGLDRGRACRLLNALYLQAGLIVSRTHPAAMGDTWFGGTP